MQPATISLRFLRYHRVRHGLRKTPGCRDDRRPADSIFKEFYTGDRLRRYHWPDRARICLAWLSGASTRMRGGTAIAAGNAPPEANYGVGPGGAPSTIVQAY